MAVCDFKVTDFRVNNCSCHELYTHSMSFGPSFNCVERVGIPELISWILFAAHVHLIFVLIYAKCYNPSSAPKTSFAIILYNTLKIVEYGLVYGLSRSNIASNLLFLFAFMTQCFASNFILMRRNKPKLGDKSKYWWAALMCTVCAGVVFVVLLGLMIWDATGSSTVLASDTLVFSLVGSIAFIYSIMMTNEVSNKKPLIQFLFVLDTFAISCMFVLLIESASIAAAGGSNYYTRGIANIHLAWSISNIFWLYGMTYAVFRKSTSL